MRLLMLVKVGEEEDVSSNPPYTYTFQSMQYQVVGSEFAVFLSLIAVQSLLAIA